MKPFARMILVSSLALAAGCASTLKVDNAPVAALDLSRYLGEWYEIARFDHSFERDVEQAKANYSLKDDGTIEVVNSGREGQDDRHARTPARLVLRSVLRRLPRDADRQGLYIRTRRQRRRGLPMAALPHSRPV